MRKFTLIAVTFLLSIMQGFAQQQVTVTSNINLRPNPSTQEAPIAVVSKGSQVTLLGASPTAGFIHVRTSDGKEGWISAKSVSSGGKGLKAANGKRSKRKLVRKPQQQEIDPAQNGNNSIMAGARSGSSACAPDLASCSENGCSPADSTHAIANQHKRATPSGSGAGIILTFDDFAALQQQADALVGEQKELTAEDRAKLSGMTVSSGSVAEGDLVSVVGYLVGTPHPNSGESVNCNLRGVKNNDFHIPISSDPGNTDFQGVVVEMVPQSRPDEWNIANLTQVESNQQLVMISGGLFYDNLHRVNSDQNHPKGGQPHRFSLFEIHPITQFMVCNKQDNSCDPSQAADWIALGGGSQ
jgi:hypothetical protein